MNLEMRLQRHPIICLSTAAVLVAGCSSSPQGVLPGASASQAAAPQNASGFSRSVQRGLLYVSGAIKLPGWVTIYPQQGNDQQRIGAITKDVDLPWGLAVDRRQNLYVGNYHNSTVTVYPRGKKSPSQTLTGAGHPVAIAVGQDGAVYVANQGNGTPPSGASILVYPKGKKTPSQTIPIANGSFAFGLALDSSGNLYATINQYMQGSKCCLGSVYEFAPGSRQGENLGLQGLNAELGGIAIDNQNNLLVVNEDTSGYSVLVFPPGETVASQKINVNTGQAPLGIAINPENSEIWITDGFGGDVEGISYPGGSLLDVIAHRRGWAFGVAISPASND